jgi:hypothetical protein
MACGYATAIRKRFRAHVATDKHNQKIGHMDPAEEPYVRYNGDERIVQKLLLVSNEATNKLPQNRKIP